MSTDYQYDDQGQFYPFFFVTLSALVTLPVTYSALKPSTELENTAPRIKSDFKTKDADFVDNQRSKQKKKERRVKRLALATFGWLFIILNIYLMINTKRTTPKIWNPYEILDVSLGTSEKQVQSKYRRLSLTMHPDKARPDESKNLTSEIINERWVEITKAYKTLTDEDVRANYEQYGNPDGPQTRSTGIALPNFLITNGNGKYVLLIYGCLIGILLPYFVGSWWYGSQKRTKEKVMVTSVGKLFREFNERIDLNGIIHVLSNGDEYDEILLGQKSNSGISELENKILSSSTNITGMNKKDETKLKDLDNITRKKVLLLIRAYLGRIDLKNSTLNDEKIEMAPIALSLNDAFISICLSYSFTNPTLSAYKASQHLIQAISPGSSPLLQLPYLTKENIKIIEELSTSSRRKHLTIQAFMDIPSVHRKELIINKAGLNQNQYDSMIKVAEQLPRLVVEKTFFKVTGEKCVLPSSLVQFVVKARFIPPGTKNIPAIAPTDLEDIDIDETNPKIRKEAELNNKQYQPPLTHAPYFAKDHSPRWNLFLTDARQGKIAVPPFTFSTFNKPILNTDDGQPTFNIQTLKMQFQAPPNVGEYKFQMHLICDSYIGFDDNRDVVMKVEDESKAVEKISEEDEISEPEEDSIAGTMAALKGDATTTTTKPKTIKKKVKVDISEDEESGTDEDVDSESETDTDTDSDED